MNPAPDTERLEFLAQLWRDFAQRDAGPYSPLYAAIGRAVAEDARLLGRIIDDVPPHAHLPIFALAAVHDLVLRGTEHPLRAAYAAGAVEQAPRLFIDFCDAQWDAIVDILQHRRVQTNECGRSAVIALALAKVASRYGTPAALVDAGASAGLNLLYDRYHLDYGSLGSLGDTASRVRVTCEVTTREALPPRVPVIPRRIGIDREPIDVMSEEDRRWLLACVWPDTGRLQRTADALQIAVEHPPDVRQGDMVDDLASTIDTIDADGLVCVMTSWAAGYLPPSGRKALGQVLDAVGTRRDVLWLSLEGSGVVNLFDPPVDRGGFEIAPSVVGVARFRNGTREAHALALVHPHGQALAWL